MRHPNRPTIAPIVVTLVAGPATRNTKAAAGGKPACTKAPAMGTDAVAQTYNGSENVRANNIAVSVPYPATFSIHDSGTICVIAADITMPTISQTQIECKISRPCVNNS